MNYLTPSLSKVAFMEAFNKKHGIDFVRVPFKGGGDAVNSMLAGTTPVAIFGIGNLIQLIRAGKISASRSTATSARRSRPTSRPSRSSATLHTWASSFGIHVPLGTPKPIVDKLNAAIVKVASDPEFQKRHMFARGLSPVLDSPEHFAKQIADRARSRPRRGEARRGSIRT